MRRSALLVAALLVLATPLLAQTTESMTVEVIEVPVYVSRDGKPIRGLTRDDFTLQVNGVPQIIDYFDVVDRRALGAGAPELNRRRMTMLLFDVSHSFPWTLRRARKAAAEFVASASPNDSYAVATLTTRGISLLVPFTTDHVNVQRAIASFSASDAGDAFGLATTAAERAVWTAAPADHELVPFDRIESPREMTAEWLQARIEREIRAMHARDMTRQLAELARALAPLEGQKSVILMSHGIAGEPQLGDSLASGDLIEMHKAFRTSGVILNAVDLEGLTAPIGQPPVPSPQLFTLALSTGGFVEHSRNNFLAALREIDEMESIVYILGFRPPAHQKAGANSIHVKVRGAGLLTEVRYRRTYMPAKPGVDAMNTMLLADILLNDIPQTGVSVRASVQPAGGSAAINVSVPRREVLAYFGDHKAIADVFIYVFDAEKTVARFAHKEIRLQGRDVLDEALHVAEVVSLGRGHYVAKVLVTLRGTNATGFAKTEFEIGG